MIKFTIVRYPFRYNEWDIVCDHCGHSLPSKFHYVLYLNGRRCNDYPFHTIECAKEHARENIEDYIEEEDFDLDNEDADEDNDADDEDDDIPERVITFEYIKNGDKDFLQEELTED